MGNLRLFIALSAVIAVGALAGSAQAPGPVSITSLTVAQGNRFEQKDLVFIQQYYSYAPQFFVDDMLKREKALPPGAAGAIAVGKPLPREIVPLAIKPPDSVTRNLSPLRRGQDRRVVGTRFLLLDAGMIVQDMIRLPTAPSENRKK